MKDLQVYSLKNVLDDLPDAEQWYKDHCDRPYFANVNTELANELMRDISAITTKAVRVSSYYKYAFLPNVSVVKDGKPYRYDWVLVEAALITQK